MPGSGRAVVERAYTEEERDALGDARSVLGEKAFDVYLNERALWRCVPAAVWNYKLGGYQVLKKWLSYRERAILKRPLKPEEVQHFTDTARRIAGILMLTLMGERRFQRPIRKDASNRADSGFLPYRSFPARSSFPPFEFLSRQSVKRLSAKRARGGGCGASLPRSVRSSPRGRSRARRVSRSRLSRCSRCCSMA